MGEVEDSLAWIEGEVRGDKVTVVKKSDIEQRKKSPLSLMPKGMLDSLHPDEILDLMAFVLAAGRSSDKAFQQ